jgi:hypothetical protein
MLPTHSKFIPLTAGLTLCCTLLLSQASLAEKSSTKSVPDMQLKQAVQANTQAKQSVQPGIQLKQAVQPAQSNVQPGFAPVFQIPFHTNCASGFSKVQSHETTPAGSNGNKWTDWYVCTTDVIACPKQIQPGNDLTSTVHPTVVLQTLGGNPDGGQISFRIQYKCDYGWIDKPVG